MAFEKRKTKTYYYQKRREGKRVTSTYHGQDECADAALSLRARDTETKWRQRARSRALHAHIESLQEPFARLDALIADLTRASLLASGCHTHKGQWRRKRATTHPPTHHPAARTDSGTAE